MITHNIPVPGLPLYNQLGNNADDQNVTFRWHWPNGTFRERMSALEIADFILPHLPSIVGLLQSYPIAQRQLMTMLVKLATPEILRYIFDVPELVPGTELYDTISHHRKLAIDKILPWIRKIDRNEEDEILELNIGARYVPDGPIFNTFVRSI